MEQPDLPPDFRTVFEVAPGRSIVLLADAPRFTIVAVSDGYLDATRKRRDELVGRGLFEAFSGDAVSPWSPLAAGAEILRDSLLRALETGAPDRPAAGATESLPAHRWRSLTTPVPGDGGRIAHLIHSLESGADHGLHDPAWGEASSLAVRAAALAEAKAILEARVEARTEDLLRSNRELEQFAYIASHDLQTPLRHITSYVQLLTAKMRDSGALDAKTEKWVGYILSGTLQMKSLISDLLSYSRIGRVDTAVEDIDTNRLVAAVAEDLQDQLRASNGTLVYGDLPGIRGIRSQLAQLLQNLIENALKFKRPGIDPVVTITAVEEGPFFRFSVADNGIGIDVKYFDRVFLMFHRLHSSSAYPGTGIGLAICNKIVEAQGGTMGLESVVGSGSTFSFTVPRMERSASTIAGERTMTFRPPEAGAQRRSEKEAP